MESGLPDLELGGYSDTSVVKKKKLSAGFDKAVFFVKSKI